jgi:hypothetical protein
MKLELQQQIWDGAPTLFEKKTYMDCGDGWFDLLRDLTKKLEQYAKAYYEKYGREQSCLMYPIQIKEKYGTLRFYMSCETDETYAMIEQTEHVSAITCERCGKPGKLRCENGWYEVRCGCC